MHQIKKKIKRILDFNRIMEFFQKTVPFASILLCFILLACEQGPQALLVMQQLAQNVILLDIVDVKLKLSVDCCQLQNSPSFT
jgi:hypothetical protein